MSSNDPPIKTTRVSSLTLNMAEHEEVWARYYLFYSLEEAIRSVEAGNAPYSPLEGELVFGERVIFQVALDFVDTVVLYLEDWIRYPEDADDFFDFYRALTRTYPPDVIRCFDADFGVLDLQELLPN